MNFFANVAASAAALMLLTSTGMAGGVQTPPKVGYTLTDLGSQVPASPDGTLAQSSAAALNDEGEVDASGINRSGQIAVTIMTAQGSYHAALLTPKKPAPIRLPVPIKRH